MGMIVCGVAGVEGAGWEVTAWFPVVVGLWTVVMTKVEVTTVVDTDGGALVMVEDVEKVAVDDVDVVVVETPVEVVEVEDVEDDEVVEVEVVVMEVVVVVGVVEDAEVVL